ncbi:MAG: DUF6116 family protein, partial [Longimicrobiales bacterium]
MAAIQRLAKGRVITRLQRLRFPYLFLLTGAVFIADLLIPDALPLVDEIFLVLLTALIGSFKDRKKEHAAEEPPGVSEDQI